jgi:hypothetical protein
MFGPMGGGFKGRAIPIATLLLGVGVLAYVALRRR